MKVTAVLLAAVLGHFAAAAPAAGARALNKRDQVVVPVVETVVVTTTVTLSPGEAAPTPDTANDVKEPPANPTPTTTPPAPAPVVAAAQQQKQKVDPPPVQTPTPTPTPPAPVPQTPAPQEKQASSGSGSGSGNTTPATGSGGQGSGSGIATNYFQGGTAGGQPVAGSCGVVHQDTDMIVALSHLIMVPLDGANPNNNPLCNKQITVTGPGGTQTAKVVDTCWGCDENHIDLSQAMFKAVGPADGVIQGVKWTVSS